MIEKRKNNKKYEYSENRKIDRTGHTYLDYLAYMHKHPGIYVWQLDFLGAIKTDSKNILTFVLPVLQFTILSIIENLNFLGRIKILAINYDNIFVFYVIGLYLIA